MVIKTQYDIVIIGAGAAGMFAAATAINNGKSVAIIDMGTHPARKVMVSGGGRCNFTNAAADNTRYFGNNPNFVRGALARFSPNDTLNWVRGHGIRPTEKSAGQYFTTNGAGDIVQALTVDAATAEVILNTTVHDITHADDIFSIITDKQTLTATSVIIATGGTSFPTLGVSDIGHKIAKKFGHKIVPVRPALCAIKTDIFPSDLSGIAVDTEIKIGRNVIRDAMLITHFGIGGPATYRATVRDLDNDLHINLIPGINVYDALRNAKQTHGRKSLATILSAYIPARLAAWIAGKHTRNIADIRDANIKQIAQRATNIVIPHNQIKLHNLNSAEVVRGGVDTADISSKTMESKLCPGLFFAGEVLDIAGDLGGFNLQWAWASGFVAGTNA